MARTAAGGSGWERFTARALGGLSPLLLSCLVTDHPQYGEPNVAPYLVKGSPADFDRARAADDTTACPTGSTMPAMPFQVSISDANIDDELLVRVFVNKMLIGRLSVRIAPTGQVERRDLTRCIDLRAFNVPCNLVEIYVSREFDEAFADQPEEPGDISSVYWWILDDVGDETDVLPIDCKDVQSLDAGST